MQFQRQIVALGFLWGQMYKVFFNERALFLTDEFSRNFQERYGLFYKYRNNENLKEIIEFYQKLSKINSLILFHYNIEELQESFKKCFKLIEAAGGIVKNSKGEYLFIFRRGKWDLPKGKLDEGENFAQAAVREVEEETGLKNVSLIYPLMSTYHTYEMNGKPILKKTYWFDMEYYGTAVPIPETEEDIEEVRWFKPEELRIPFKNTFPLVIDLFRYLGLKT